MFSTTIRRSAGALAVTAGLLAAAAPASHGATQPPSRAQVTMTDYIVSSFSWGMSDPGTTRVKASTVLEDAMISGYDVKAKTANGSSLKLTELSGPREGEARQGQARQRQGQALAYLRHPGLQPRLTRPADGESLEVSR